MSFRVQTNVAALNSHRQLTQVGQNLSKSMERLSSGFRINRAADDAAGLAIANRFRADIRSMEVAQRNISEATSLVQITEGATSNIEAILERMKELSTQAASANAGGQLTALDDEFQALISEIDRTVGATNYQGQALIGGAFNGTFQVGPSNATNDQLAVDLTSANLATTALGDATDGFVSAMDLTSQANAQKALTVLDNAIAQVNGVLGKLGAYQNRLDYASASVATTIQNYKASESTIRDVDMAAEMVNFTKFQILQQVGTSMLAQANAAPQSVLSLVG